MDIKMNKYVYKQFEVIYEIKINPQNTLYEAHAYAICLANKQNPLMAHEFSTEAKTWDEAETELKKLVNNYIDFEWKQSKK